MKAVLDKKDQKDQKEAAVQEAFEELKPALRRAGYFNVLTQTDLDRELSVFDRVLAYSYISLRWRVIYRSSFKSQASFEQAMEGAWTLTDKIREVEDYVNGRRELTEPEFFGTNCNFSLMMQLKDLSKEELANLVSSEEDKNWAEIFTKAIKDGIWAESILRMLSKEVIFDHAKFLLRRFR